MSDRDAFEKWAKGLLDLQHIGPCYGDEATQTAFEAWQAAQAQTLLEVIRDDSGCPTKALQHSGEPVVDELCKALSDIAEWTDRYTAPNHPISVIAKKALLSAGKENNNE
jgi:hypothetical protein